MNGHQTGSLSAALGWVLLVGILHQNLSPIGFSVVLSGLLLAEILSSLLVIGLNGNRNMADASSRHEDAMGRLLLRWVILVISIVLLARNDTIAAFEDNDYALFCVLGLSLTLALTKLACALRIINGRFWILLVRLRSTLLAIGIFEFGLIAPLNADAVLSLTLGFFLMMLIVVSVTVKSSVNAEMGNRLGSDRPDRALFAIPQLLFRYADILLLAVILQPQDCLAYLIARGLATIVSLALGLLSGRIAHTLGKVYGAGNNQAFVSVAARVNLGFLLVGGGASLLTLSLGGFVPKLLGLDANIFLDLLFLLLTAEAAPVVFGATGILLNVADCKRELTLLSCLGILALFSSTIILRVSDPLELAQLFAYAQMVIVGISAGLLGLKFGIWPGVTALLFRQIRLL